MLSSLTRALRRKKIREGSSSEESYASPATTASSGISTPSPPPGHRFRRNRGSSTDDDNDDDNDDDILNEDYRVGGPQLAPLPCQPVNLTQGPVYNIWLDEKFPTAILRIAEKHKVDIKAIVLQGRVASNPNFRSAGVLPTVVISAKRHNLTDHSWASACREILQLFAQKGLHDLNVEIIDDRALIQNFPTAVPATDPIFPLWDKVMDMIHSHISRDGWQSLECLRWGPNEDGLSNPTTVILTVPYDTERNWKATREIIVHVLQYFKLPGVAVAILRGQVWRGMGFGTVTLPDNAWDQKVQVGMSIGPSGDKMSGSTIGAVLELESPHSGKWVSFGITCFHCVVARSINSDEEKRGEYLASTDQGFRLFSGIYRVQANRNAAAHNQWSENGVMPDDELATKYLNMDQPALRDHLDRMGKINEEIREIDEDQEIIQYRHDLINDSFIIPKEASCKRKIDRRAGYMAFMANAEKFFTQGHAHLGHVYAASGGFRLTEEKPRIQLDWALITINSQRLGPNKVCQSPLHGMLCSP